VSTTTYRLGSSGMVHTPGIVRWAIAGYWHKPDRKQLVKVITEGWGVPQAAAVALLSGSVPHTVEGDAVVFEA